MFEDNEGKHDKGVNVGYPQYFDYITVYLSTVGYLADKISSSLNIHHLFHWFRKVLVSERLTNEIHIYPFTNRSYENFKVAAGIYIFIICCEQITVFGVDEFDDFQLF